MHKRVGTLLLSILIFSLVINCSVIFAQSTVKGFDVDDPRFKDKVIEDVKLNSKEELIPLQDKNIVYEYTLEDLFKAEMAIGKADTHLDSLRKLFIGGSYGERRLYIVSGQPFTEKYQNAFVGYLLYKTPEGSNVLKKVRRGTKRWEVINVIEK